MHVVQCPSCKKQTPCQHYSFQYEDLDRKIKCIECHRPKPTRGWKCNCGVLWYMCEVHKYEVNIRISRIECTHPKSSKVIPSGSLHANAPFEQILDDDLRIEAKRANKCLKHDASSAGTKMPYKLKASMLSPKLRERFNHLL